MEEENLFFEDRAERRQTTLQGRMEDLENEKERLSFRQSKKRLTKEYWQECMFKRFPVITWMRGYTFEFLLKDMIAGLTVGLTAVPQGIAYAIVAGLEPQYGLYSGFMGCFVYFFLGSVKDLTIGPTAIMALLVRKLVENYNSDFAVLLCFLSGCITLVLGLLRLGFLVNFISYPVTVGFTTSAALTIAGSQFKGLLGIPGKSDEFLAAVISIIRNIGQTRLEDLCLGLVTIFFLVGVKILNQKMSQRLKSAVAVKKSTRIYIGSFEFVALGRNGIAVIAGAVTAFILEKNGLTPFTLTGNVKGGFPEFRPPPFSTNATVRNETVFLPFMSMVTIMNTALISVPLISILETIAIGKTFAKGNTLNATQELIALGACKIFGSFVQSMPVAGSFTRSVVNNASGVKTPLGGLLTGGLVLSALTLTSTFRYIPKASLAAVILTAMFYMVDYHDFVLIWRLNKMDFIPLTVTIVFCLTLGLDIGILIGVMVNVLFILYINIKPKVTHEDLTVLNEDVVVFHLQQTPIYPGAEYIRGLVMKTLRFKKVSLIIINGERLSMTDSTTLRTFKILTQNLGKLHQEFVLWNWPSKYKALYSRMDDDLSKRFYNTSTLEQLLEMIKNTPNGQ